MALPALEWTISRKVMKETEIKNSYNTCQLQKPPAEKPDLSYIGYWTEIIALKLNLNILKIKHW